MCPEDEECKTPTLPGSRIPAILSCPPAPRKRRAVLRPVACKRKLEFFEVIHFEEIEEFFNRVELVRRTGAKRSRSDV